MMLIILVLFGVLIAYLINEYLKRGFMTESKSMFKTLGAILYILIPMLYLLIYRVQQGNISPLSIIKILIFIAIMHLIALIDYEYHIIPNNLIILLLSLRGVLIIFELTTLNTKNFTILKIALGNGILTGGCFLIAYLITKGAVGAGDVKLMFVMGLYFTTNKAITTLFYSLVLSAIFGVFLIVIKKQSSKSPVPFAPFVYLGSILASLQVIN